MMDPDEDKTAKWTQEGLREASQWELPAAFLARMKRLLGDEYGAFLESFRMPRTMGLRLNPLKLGELPDGPDAENEAAEKWKNAGERAAAQGNSGQAQLSGKFFLRRVPWAREGYYYDDRTRPGRHPYHEAGLYYIQEPSAMAAAELLDPQPGEKILDLCAAPGGKTTQIAGRMMGKGLLVSNEIHPARARILSQNVERFGAANVVVTNESPDRLRERFPAFFDRILVDAPCSGEGMFRKDETARNEWSEEHVRLCAVRQAEILDCAAVMLRPGGRLVYSTCTFAPEENEGSIQRLLDRHPEFFVEKTAGREGFSAGRPDWAGGCGRPELAFTWRIWPHRAGGEGHYIAVLRKKGGDEAEADFSGPGKAARRKKVRTEKEPQAANSEKTGRKGPKDTRRSGSPAEALWRTFCKENLLENGSDGGGPCGEPFFCGETEPVSENGWTFTQFGDQLYSLPAGMPDYAGLRVLRPGLHLGTVKGSRLEPSHALALYLKKEQVRRCRELTEEEAARYLRGETIAAEDRQADASSDGWTLMLLDGWSLGWAKRVGNVLKNHYPKGLRRMG